VLYRYGPAMSSPKIIEADAKPESRRTSPPIAAASTIFHNF